MDMRGVVASERHPADELLKLAKELMAGPSVHKEFHLQGNNGIVIYWSARPGKEVRADQMQKWIDSTEGDAKDDLKLLTKSYLKAAQMAYGTVFSSRAGIIVQFVATAKIVDDKFGDLMIELDRLHFNEIH